MLDLEAAKCKCRCRMHIRIIVDDHDAPAGIRLGRCRKLIMLWFVEENQIVFGRVHRWIHLKYGSMLGIYFVQDLRYFMSFGTMTLKLTVAKRHLFFFGNNKTLFENKNSSVTAHCDSACRGVLRSQIRGIRRVSALRLLK